ncbi:unnamed protein product [Gongylonema pulchrum]|uniref:DUF4177 domain-containing protein n=1 Tax=Gongylonema pulchrum TaxID=637853 RepID=A0A183DXX3_9BILA|nr:unnamed protein product [Gongylonema pulchrum]
MAISAAGFSFRENGISDETIHTEIKTHLEGANTDGWELVRNEENSKVLRRLRDGSGLYEFRCSGSYE